MRRINVVHSVMAANEYIDVKWNMVKFNDKFNEFKALHTSCIQVLHEKDTKRRSKKLP